MKVQDYKAYPIKFTFILALFLCFFSFQKVSAATISIGVLENFQYDISFTNSYTFSTFSSSQIHTDIESFISTNHDVFVDRYYTGSDWFDKYNYICVAFNSNGYKCYVQLTNAINDIVYNGVTDDPDSFYLSFNRINVDSSFRFYNIGFAYNFYLEYDASGNLLTNENLGNLCPATNLCGQSLYYENSYSGIALQDLTVYASLLDSYNNKFYNVSNINTSYFTSYYTVSQYYKLVSNGSYNGDHYNSTWQERNSVFLYDYSNINYLYYHNDFTEGGGDDSGGGESIDDSVVLNSINSKLSSLLEIIGSSGSVQSPGSFGAAGSYGTNECLGLHCITQEWNPTFTTVISQTMSAIEYLFYLLDRVANLNNIVFNMILVSLGLGVARLVLGR